MAEETQLPVQGAADLEIHPCLLPKISKPDPILLGGCPSQGSLMHFLGTPSRSSGTSEILSHPERLSDLVRATQPPGLCLYSILPVFLGGSWSGLRKGRSPLSQTEATVCWETQIRPLRVDVGSEEERGSGGWPPCPHHLQAPSPATSGSQLAALGRGGAVAAGTCHQRQGAAWWPGDKGQAASNPRRQGGCWCGECGIASGPTPSSATLQGEWETVASAGSPPLPTPPWGSPCGRHAWNLACGHKSGPLLSLRDTALGT